MTFWLGAQCLNQLHHHTLECVSSCHLHLNFIFSQTSLTKVALGLQTVTEELTTVTGKGKMASTVSRQSPQLH